MSSTVQEELLGGLFTKHSLKNIEESVRVYRDAVEELKGIIPQEVVDGSSVDLENLVHEEPKVREQIVRCLNTMSETRDEIRTLLLQAAEQLDRPLDLIDSDWSRIIPILEQLMQTIPEREKQREP